ncbi:MAG: cytosine/adenosine deaminase-related metal-dependent hydrolase [Planctomycetota bacterium]|jgi:cytosine/adenosine deaminase-related metal-dependent hydrolase
MVNPRSVLESTASQVLLADWVMGPEAVPIKCGALGLFEGRISRVFEGHGAARRWAESHSARVQVLPSGILAPGWVNAHCHLELTGLAGQVSCEGGFFRWIGRIMHAKAAMDLADYRRGVQLGADRLLRGGTTSVGDIDSQNVGGDIDSPIRMLLYREALDAFHPHRTQAALASVVQPMGLREGLQEGLAPHASFTASAALLRGMAEVARSRSLPVTVHWSETQAEVDWLRDGEGSLAAVLGPSPHQSGLDLIEQAGLLESTLSLVHGNWPAAGEAERIAQAGATLVHCPGSHSFFGRERFPLEEYLEAGVCLAIGTDSQASNQELSMGREVALLRAAYPELDARSAFLMGTEHGARALGWTTWVGRILEGFRADLSLFGAQEMSQDDVLERLTTENLPVVGVWVEGRRVV